MILIIAGSYQQALGYADATDVPAKEWRYVSLDRPQDALGYPPGQKVLLVGTYNYGKRWCAFRAMLEARQYDVTDAVDLI